MLLCGQALLLRCKVSQTSADAESGVSRLNDIVDIAILGSLIGIGKEFGILLFLLCQEGLDVFTCLLLGLGLLG